MAASETLPMLQEFPRWIAASGIGDDDTRRAARWAGASALARGTDRDLIEALLRVALKCRHAPSPTALQTIRNAYYAADNTFEMQGNDKELQILAGTTLAAIMSLPDDKAAEAAVAVSSALVGGHRKSQLPMDLNVLAEAAIERIAENNRRRPSLSTFVTAEVPKFDFETAGAKAKEGNWENVAAGLTLAADAARGAMASLARRQAKVVGALDRFLRIQDEELQMLWWLTGERSLDLDERFDAVPDTLQPLVFAKELADATEFLPGPPSVRALLSRAGLKNHKKIAVSTVINAGDAAWLKSFMPQTDPSPVTNPLHFGIARQLETGAGDAWIAGWAAAVELPTDLAVAPLALAMLLYRERLLMLFKGD